MKNSQKIRTVGLSVIAASLSLAYGSALAQDDVVMRLIKPESSVQLGLGYLTEDAARFGQYRAMADSGLYGIADFNLVQRDNESGRWIRAQGRNLGFDNRSVRFEHSVQGRWKYFVEYDQLSRHSQYTVNTGLQGIGHANVAINGVPLRDKRLRTEREAISAGGQYVITDGVDLQVRVKQETKQGARLFGERTTSAVNFMAEPIDHTMSQVDVVLGYTGDRLQLSGGYYGSFFENDDPALRIPARTPSTPAGSTDRLALPPDNYAHQFYLAGGYSFTPTTRGNFKVARTFAYQDDDFINSTSSTSGVVRTDLNGKLETTLAQVGLSARPLQKLSIVADWRYENRDDQTPQLQYFNRATTGTFSGFNETRDYETNNGKLEARYMLPAGFKAVAGVDYDEKKRDVYAERLVTTRKRTEELSHRVELSRSLSDTATGSLSYIKSDRTGSDLMLAGFTQTTGYVSPVHLADRDREKVRLRVDWTPAEVLSFQVTADSYHDRYKTGGYGVDKGYGYFFSLDGAYAFTDEWQTNAWVSREYARQVNSSFGRQSGGSSNNANWLADLRNLTEAFGLGLRGTLGSAWKIGADLQYAFNQGDYGINSAGSAAITPVSDAKFTQTTLKLFGEYAMRKDLALRVEAVHDQFRTNDWQWVNFTYADGTTLSQDTAQETTFVGVSMRYKWR